MKNHKVIKFVEFAENCRYPTGCKKQNLVYTGPPCCATICKPWRNLERVEDVYFKERIKANDT